MRYSQLVPDNKGTNPNMQLTGSWNGERQTPLIVAAENGRNAIVELFLTHPDVNIEQKGPGNWTLLCYAVEQGDKVLVKRLLDKGADPNVQVTLWNDSELHDVYRSPLSIATENGYDAIVKLLLEAGANANFKATGSRLHDEVSWFNQRYLSLVAEKGDKAVTALLLNQKHAQVNFKEDAGRTPFHLALLKGHIHVAKRLMLSGGSFTGEKLELDRYFNRRSPRMPAEHQDLVWILSLDNDTIEVERDVAELSMLIKSMLQLIGDMGGSSSQENPIQLPYANGTILRKVFQWCEHHRDTVTPENTSLQIGEWDQNYMQVNMADVVEITQAAYFLGIGNLWYLGCQVLALGMQGKSAEEIREHFNIINNLAHEKEKEIRW